MNLHVDSNANKYNTTELSDSIIDRDIDFETVNLSWNIYKLKNGMIVKGRLIVQTVNRTDKFDALGLPVYYIESNLDLKVNLPPKLGELIEKINKDT